MVGAEGIEQVNAREQRAGLKSLGCLRETGEILTTYNLSDRHREKIQTKNSQRSALV
jgi:hypothetical protein